MKNQTNYTNPVVTETNDELTITLQKKKQINWAILFKIIVYAVLIFGSVLLVFPFLWMLLSSFKTGDEATLRFTFFPRTMGFQQLCGVVYGNGFSHLQSARKYGAH